jgi:hypothetical protein
VDEQSDTKRSPSQVLIDCLEDFGNDEPLEVVVTYRTKSGDLAWQTNIDANSHFIGLLRLTEIWYLEKVKSRNGGG